MMLLALIITIIVVITSSAGDTYDPKLRIIPYSSQNLDSQLDSVFVQGCADPMVSLEKGGERMNATFVMLTRNEELKSVVNTIKSIESHFNQWFHYPYVFLNNEPFTEEFQTEVSRWITTDDVEFGTLNEIEWEFPQEVTERPEFQQFIHDQGDRGILYGNMESYHRMCRFYSGIFYKHPLLQKREWYWRLEPDVEFFCDLTYDPFREMSEKGKRYGFTVFIPELYWTVPNLCRSVKSFIREKKVEVKSVWKLFTTNYNVMDPEQTPEELNQWINFEEQVEGKILEKVGIDFLLENEEHDNEKSWKLLIDKAKSKKPLVEDKFDNEEYNLCHFWSNFEIARIDTFDNEIYNSFFQYLESSGGFWKERWGDAPVHSFGLSLVLNLDEVHYFRDIGYRHSQVYHCPKNSRNQLPYKQGDNDIYKRKRRTSYDSEWDNGTGCRCKCPDNKRELEDTTHHCFDLWLELTHELDNRKLVNFKSLETQIKHDFINQLKEMDQQAVESQT